tara:strand:+ start:3060 stop:3278 length:219 start_codon:yes stop_codon:yes gene_type:complete
MSNNTNLLDVLNDISLNITNLKQKIQDDNINNQLYEIDLKIYNINKKLINVFSVNSNILNLRKRIDSKLNNN